jgi:hypothetical protein
MAHVPDEAVDRSHEISASAFRLYAFYCKHRNAETGICWPSLRRAAETLHMAYSYTSEMKAQLAAAGWIALRGDEIKPLMGFASEEEMAAARAKVSEKPKRRISEKPKHISEIPNKVSEKPKSEFGKTEIHVYNQPNEPAHITSPYNQDQPRDKRAGFTAEAQEVFAHWQKVLNHPSAKLTKDRETKIKARLREGYTVEQCKRAVDGCRASPYHMGQNDRGSVYDGIDLIFRNGEKLEQFIGYAASPPQGGSANGRQQQPRKETDEERRARELAEYWARSAAADEGGGDGAGVTQDQGVAAAGSVGDGADGIRVAEGVTLYLN